MTEDNLVYTAGAMKLVLTAEKRQSVLDAYLSMEPWPDAAEALRRLRASGVRVITTSDFSPEMLRANAERAGIADLFDELLSNQSNGTYKPESRTYALGMERLGLQKEEIPFAAFGGWDAYGVELRLRDVLGEPVPPAYAGVGDRAGRNVGQPGGPVEVRPRQVLSDDRAGPGGMGVSA